MGPVVGWFKAKFNIPSFCPCHKFNTFPFKREGFLLLSKIRGNLIISVPEEGEIFESTPQRKTNFVEMLFSANLQTSLPLQRFTIISCKLHVLSFMCSMIHCNWGIMTKWVLSISEMSCQSLGLYGILRLKMDSESGFSAVGTRRRCITPILLPHPSQTDCSKEIRLELISQI